MTKNLVRAVAIVGIVAISTGLFNIANSKNEEYQSVPAFRLQSQTSPAR